jgi:hypothetical protein
VNAKVKARRKPLEANKGSPVVSAYPLTPRMKMLLSSVTSKMSFSEAKQACEKTFVEVRRQFPVKGSPTRLEARNNALFDRIQIASRHLPPTIKQQNYARHKRISEIATHQQRELDKLRETDSAYYRKGLLNCGESCQLAINSLKKRKVPATLINISYKPAQRFFPQNDEHGVLVVNTKPNFQLDMPATHTGQEVFFDPQNGIWDSLHSGLDKSLQLFGVAKGATPTRNYNTMATNQFYFSQQKI